MNIKKSVKAIVAAVSMATSMCALASGDQDSCISTKTNLAQKNSVEKLKSCKTIDSCREAGLEFGKITAQMGDECVEYRSKQAWHIGAISAVSAMRKYGAISDAEEDEMLMYIIGHARGTGVYIDTSEGKSK